MISTTATTLAVELLWHRNGGSNRIYVGVLTASTPAQPPNAVKSTMYKATLQPHTQHFAQPAARQHNLRLVELVVHRVGVILMDDVTVLFSAADVALMLVHSVMSGALIMLLL